jgi:aminoglycoside 6'-N-acetyltransferase I
MNLQVIQFDLSMLQECVDLYQQVFSKEPWFDHDERSDVECYFKNFFKNNQFVGYVAKVDNRIVGFSIGFVKPWIKGEEYYIDQFCIDYSLQGQGIGTLMMNEIKKDLKSKNINAMLLNTEKEVPAYMFYLKNGFLDFEDLRILGAEF